MKFASLKRSLALALPLAALSLEASPVALAQPAPAVGQTGKTGRRGRKANTGITPKMLAAIEAKTGKPVSAEQKTQLDAAAATHRLAVKAADAQYRGDIARITGLSDADTKALGRKPKGARNPKAGTVRP